MPQFLHLQIGNQSIHLLGLLGGICEIKQKGNYINLIFENDKKLDLKAISGVIEKFRDKILFYPGVSSYITIKNDSKNIINNIKIVLQAFKELKEEVK